MVFVKKIGHKIDFIGNCIAESTAHIFVIYLNFRYTHIISIEFFEKKILPCKKISSGRPISNFLQISEDSLDFVRKLYKKLPSSLFKVILVQTSFKGQNMMNLD